MKIEEIQFFLPKYLSSNSENELFSCLNDFPDNIDDRIYTSYLQDNNIIYQGDGIDELLVFKYPSCDSKKAKCIVLSNTCDLDLNNTRNFPSNIVYAPIIKLETYKNQVLSETGKNAKQIEDHLKAIKAQRITQVFYLPEYSDKLKESIVFLDRIYSIPNDYVDREKLNNKKIFTLSDYGIYLFLFKLSLHFTRMQDKVERRSTRLP